MTPDPDPHRWLDALAGSHDSLAALVGDLAPADLTRQSYCSEWTVAQVLSHLGSGAEIFRLYLDAAVAGDPPPEREAAGPVWARWDAMTPAEQAEQFVTTDGDLVEALEALGDRLEDLHFVLFGRMELDGAGFVATRLGEHALHAWDVAVTFDPGATVAGDAAALLVDRVPLLAQRLGKADAAEGARPFSVTVATTAPERAIEIEVTDAVAVHEAAEAPAGGRPDGAGAQVELPAEALVRLVYGRLDPAHTPAVGGRDPDALDRLRVLFPGF